MNLKNNKYSLIRKMNSDNIIDNSNNIFKYNCDKCDYHCNYESEWIKHTNTELHKTGIKKKRSDYKEPFKCEVCDYKSKNKTSLKKHYLHEHANKEERKKQYKFYCDNCDYGCFYDYEYDNHLNTDKHKKTIERLK
jgi:hypothetical protein